MTDSITIQADLWFDGRTLRETPVMVHLERGLVARIDEGPFDDASPIGGRGAIDARGRLLMPGLVNAHVHIVRGGMFEPNEPIGFTQGAHNLRDTLAAGVTTVGDMGCSAGLATSIKELTRRRPTLGPSIVASGPLVTAPGGYPLDWMPPLFVKLGLALGCADERAAIEAVKGIADSGMDHVKLAIMHQGYADTPLPALDVKVARAAVHEAHALGLRAVAHAHGVADYRVALAAGVDALMHSSFEPLDADLVSQVRDAGIPVCPTLWVFESTCLGPELALDHDPRFTEHVTPSIRRSWSRFVDAWNASGDVVPPGIAGGAKKTRAEESVRNAAANLKLLIDAKVPIAFGNDANYGFSLVARPVDELSAMQRAGMDPEACLRSATTGAASLLGLTDRGHISVGARADLIVVDREVRVDVARIEHVHHVITAGELVPPRTGREALAAHALRSTSIVRGLARTALAALRPGRPT